MSHNKCIIKTNEEKKLKKSQHISLTLSPGYSTEPSGKTSLFPLSIFTISRTVYLHLQQKPPLYEIQSQLLNSPFQLVSLTLPHHAKRAHPWRKGLREGSTVLLHSECISDPVKEREDHPSPHLSSPRQSKRITVGGRQPLSAATLMPLGPRQGTGGQVFFSLSQSPRESSL